MLPDVKSLRIDRDTFQQTLDKKLSDLPSLPAVVAQIMQAANNPNTTADEIQRLIASDQGLASKILRIVNSAYYGFPKKVSTISQAVMILGFTTVRNLVMGVSAFGMLGQKSMPYGLNRQKFWEHCAATAAATSILGQKRLPKNQNIVEEAFLGGLLHDIGSLFLDSYFPVQFAVAMAFAAREQKTAREAESAVLGVDHVTVGKRISEKWNFPPHVTAMIAQHHNPDAKFEFYEMIALTHAGNWLAWECGYAASEHAVSPVLDQEVKDWLLIEEAEWDPIKAQLKEAYGSYKQLIQAMQ